MAPGQQHELIDQQPYTVHTMKELANAYQDRAEAEWQCLIRIYTVLVAQLSLS